MNLKNISRIVRAALFFSIAAVYSIFARRKRNRKIIACAPTYLNGNVKAIYDFIIKDQRFNDCDIYWIAHNADELKDLKTRGIKAFLDRDILRIPRFFKTGVWITDHGAANNPLHWLYAWKIMSIKKIKGNSAWIDTWHGMATLEEAVEGRAKMLKYYDIGFVSSEFLRHYYSSKEDGILDKLKVTGFPRTDPLLEDSFNKQEIIKELDVPQNKRNILYAPSWGNPAAGEDKEKKIFPFESNTKILDDIDKFCIKNNCNFIIRMHPMWENEENEYAEKIIEVVKKTQNVFYLPFKKYPVTEPILYISDILVTDYSSIADDFILLDRPIIYLDVSIPEEKLVFNLSDRVGYIVKSKNDFFGVLQKSFDSPEQFREEFKESRQKLIKKMYKYVDGKASQRCADEIIKLI